MFLASLNIFIGVFNLFPMLPFDGGHVVIACYEKAQEMRRRTTQRYLSDVSRLVPVAYVRASRCWSWSVCSRCSSTSPSGVSL